MSLPYENATSGQNAIRDIQKMLRKFGCAKFATGEDYETGDLFVRFEHRGRTIHLTASAKGYAAAWLKENPYTHRRRCTKAQHEAKAIEIGGVAAYSILRDWVKGQITAIEIGVMSFEAAFMPHFMLPNGQRLIERVQAENILPSPKDSTND